MSHLQVNTLQDVEVPTLRPERFAEVRTAEGQARSRVGGIQSQIEDGTTGYLVDAEDLRAFGERVTALFDDPHAAERMGEEAQRLYVISSSARAT